MVSVLCRLEKKQGLHGTKRILRGGSTIKKKLFTIAIALRMMLMNLIIKGKHKKTLIFPVFSGDSVFNRIHDWLGI